MKLKQKNLTMANLITIDWDSSDDDFDTIYDLEVGEVFKFKKNPETLVAKIATRKPDVLSIFEVRLATPGSEYYTAYGDNTMVVALKE